MVLARKDISPFYIQPIGHSATVVVGSVMHTVFCSVDGHPVPALCVAATQGATERHSVAYSRDTH